MKSFELINRIIDGLEGRIKHVLTIGPGWSEETALFDSSVIYLSHLLFKGQIGSYTVLEVPGSRQEGGNVRDFSKTKQFISDVEQKVLGNVDKVRSAKVVEGILPTEISNIRSVKYDLIIMHETLGWIERYMETLDVLYSLLTSGGNVLGMYRHSHSHGNVPEGDMFGKWISMNSEKVGVEKIVIDEDVIIFRVDGDSNNTAFFRRYWAEKRFMESEVFGGIEVSIYPAYRTNRAVVLTKKGGI